MKQHILFVACAFMVQFSAFGQQNFFNVPSSDITPKKKLFFQQQANLTTQTVQFNTTFSYGLGKNTEIGINFLGFTAGKDFFKKGFETSGDVENTPLFPFVMVNFAKAFPITESFKLAAGTQFGVDISKKIDEINTGGYVYLNAVKYIEKTHTKLVLGLYGATDDFVGTESRNFLNKNVALSEVGIQSGIEQNIWDERLVFQADFISGKHNIGETVVGFAYYLTPKWVLSSGYQIPNKNSLSSKSIVFELTFSPK